MSNEDTLRDAQIRRPDALTDDLHLQEVLENEDRRAFGWLRGQQERAIMLEFRRRNGSSLAVGYNWLEKAEFDPGEGIVLIVGETTIRIRGRNLNAEMRPNIRLYEGITRHRVPWIREASQYELLTSTARETAIESIEWG